MILVMRITLILWFATFLAQAKEEEKLIKAKSHDVTLSKKELCKPIIYIACVTFHGHF